MYHLSVADVHRYVVDGSFAVAIEDQITRTHIAGFYSRTHLRLGTGIMRQADAEVFKYRKCIII